MTDSEVVRAMFDCYLNQNRARAEQLIADDFVFTSPQDDHIDRTLFFERCFPTASRLNWQKLLDVAPADKGVFVLYEYELQSGERFRNAEFITVDDDERVRETQVFFGGPASSA